MADKLHGDFDLKAISTAFFIAVGTPENKHPTLDILALPGEQLPGLLVEQNVHHSLRLADRVHVLENGRVVRSGTPAELRQDQAIQQAYLGL